MQDLGANQRLLLGTKVVLISVASALPAIKLRMILNPTYDTVSGGQQIVDRQQFFFNKIFCLDHEINVA